MKPTPAKQGSSWPKLRLWDGCDLNGIDRNVNIALQHVEMLDISAFIFSTMEP
jgi:hypothetical protein